MKLLEVLAVIRATKYDLFTGDVENMHSKQGIKENTTVFYLDWETNAISGRILAEYIQTSRRYMSVWYGKCGVVSPFLLLLPMSSCLT
jgi:hypothetical protein